MLKRFTRLIDKVEGHISVDDVDISKTDLARHRATITIIPQVREIEDDFYHYSYAYTVVLVLFNAGASTLQGDTKIQSGSGVQILRFPHMGLPEVIFSSNN